MLSINTVFCIVWRDYTTIHEDAHNIVIVEHCILYSLGVYTITIHKDTHGMLQLTGSIHQYRQIQIDLLLPTSAWVIYQDTGWHTDILYGLCRPLIETKYVHDIKGEIFVDSEIGVNLINSFIYLLSVQLSVLSTFPFPSCLNFLILDHWAISYLPVLGIYRRQPTTNQNQQKLQKLS